MQHESWAQGSHKDEHALLPGPWETLVERYPRRNEWRMRKDRVLLRHMGTKSHQNIEEDNSGPVTYCASSPPSLGPHFPFCKTRRTEELRKHQPHIHNPPWPPARAFFGGRQAVGLVLSLLLSTLHSCFQVLACAGNSSGLSSESNPSEEVFHVAFS